MGEDIHIEKLRRFCHDCTFLEMNPNAMTGVAAITGFDPRAGNPNGRRVERVTPDRMLITRNIC